jgi:hypothetical protein
MNHVDERPLDPLTVELYAPAGRGMLTVQDEDRPEIVIDYEETSAGLRVRCQGAPGRVVIVVYGRAVREAVQSGQPLALQAVTGGWSVTPTSGGGEVVFA